MTAAGKTVLLVAVSLATVSATQQAEVPGFRDTPFLPGDKWRVHDADRPQPAVVIPGAPPGAPPSDATVLFDGGSTDAWRAQYRPWQVEDGALTVPARAQDAPENALVTRESFGDVQLHLEFRTPDPSRNASQERGNSGIWFMQRYEVQILDSYHNPTFADGMIGALFGWKPPLANPARGPGEWQSFDIIFERPRFTSNGKLRRPAYVTALLNGVLIQNHQAILGSVAWRKVASYQPHADAAPLQLQDHGYPVAFRNIWVRALPAEAVAQDSVGGAK